MEKKGISRRGFLSVVSGLGIATAIGKLLKFFPELDPILAKGGTPTNPSLQPPKDLVLKPIEGKAASQIISRVLKSKDVRALQKKLPSYTYKPGPNEAWVTSAVWSAGTKKAIIVAIHFTNPQGYEASLQEVTMNGISEDVMVEFPDKSDISKARIHTISDGQVHVTEAASAVTLASSNCNKDMMVSCLRAWGCSGAWLVACMTAFITCPWTMFGCIAAFGCALYCGGAFSKCWCWLCGC